MHVRVKLFGSLREAIGQKELSLDLPAGTSIAVLRDRLAAEHAAVGAYGTKLAVSRNLEIARLDAVLEDGDEVAFLPPVSGGSVDDVSTCTLSSQPLDVGEVTRRVAGPGMGGVVVFIGAVRDHARGQSIRRLEYEAYPGMAEREMQKICDAAAERWPGTRVAIAHREGQLEIGDLAVIVVAAAPHRAEAFEACRYAIDTLKQTVPIWKKEFASSGDYWVDDRP